MNILKSNECIDFFLFCIIQHLVVVGQECGAALSCLSLLSVYGLILILDRDCQGELR